MLIHLVHGQAGQSTWGAGRREGPGCRMAEPGFGPLPACLLPVSFFPVGPYHTGWDMLGTEGDCRGRARGQTAQVRSWLLRASLCDVGQVTSSTRSLFSSSIYKTEAGAAASQRRTPLPRRAAGPALGTEWPLAEHTLLPVSRLHCMTGCRAVRFWQFGGCEPWRQTEVAAAPTWVSCAPFCAPTGP